MLAKKTLALTVNLNPVMAQYCSMRLSAEERGCQLYPVYKRVVKAKAECLPPTSVCVCCL